MIPIESRSFTFTNHASQALQVMSELRDSRTLCDVVLCIGSHEFHAHRVVLAGCSPYLKAMFTNGMLESEKNAIEIHDLEPSTMEALLKYMYHGRVDISVENVQALLQGASMLNLAMLRNICCQFLQLHIDASNCLGIQSFADMYSCVELEAIARRYVFRHFLDVIQHEEYLNLSEDRLVWLLQSNSLQVQREEQVFEAVRLWVEWDQTRRTRSSCTVLKNVRLALLDPPYLEGVVLRTQFVQNCAKCQNLVANAIRAKGDSLALAQTLRSQPQGLFVLGGRNSTDCQLCSMEWYDVLQNRWTSMTALQIARTAVGAASASGIIYAVGGECALADSQEETEYLRSTEAYDPMHKQWQHRASMKVPRSFVSVCAVGAYIYAIGGEDRMTTYNIVERYDTIRDVWLFAPSMKKQRSGAGVAVCNGKIYIAGGYDKNIHTDRASVECFDPDTQEWNFVAEMEKARSGLSLVALDHYIYAIGGRSRYSDFYFNTVERYNTWTHQWTAVAQMNTQRAWPGVAILDNNIYVIGGFDGINRLRSVEVYNPDQDSWTFISGMNICRAGCAAAVL